MNELVHPEDGSSTDSEGRDAEGGPSSSSSGMKADDGSGRRIFTLLAILDIAGHRQGRGAGHGGARGAGVRVKVGLKSLMGGAGRG